VILSKGVQKKVLLKERNDCESNWHDTTDPLVMLLAVFNLVTKYNVLSRVKSVCYIERYLEPKLYLTAFDVWFSFSGITDSLLPRAHQLSLLLWGVVLKNIISDRFSTKTAISAHI